MSKTVRIVACLTLIAGLCAAVLASVNRLTEGPVRESARANEERAVRAVLPAGVATVVPKGDVFVGVDAAGRPIGYAAKGRDSKGYGGDIVLMVGFEKDRKTLVCYRTLEASETPGLGMKLSSHEFAGQFRGKDALTLRLKARGGEIEAIASATITSKAVIRAIADAQGKLTET